MEISQFLQRKETGELRHSFLLNVQEKNEKILANLNALKEDRSVDRVQTTAAIFLEVHRLKGSGGTYGFNEISLVFREVLLYIRPAHENKREATALETAQSISILTRFQAYMPFLFQLFGKFQEVSRTSVALHLPVLCIVNQDRREAVEKLETLCMQHHFNLMTVQNSEEGLFALSQIRPGCLIIDRKIDDNKGLEFLGKLQKHKDFKSIPAFILSPQPADKEKEEALHRGAVGYIRDTDISDTSFVSLAAYLRVLKPGQG